MIFSFKIFSEKCWVSMTGIIFSEERILIHVNIRCCGPYRCKFLFLFCGTKSVRDKTSIGVCICKRFVLQ